MIRDIGHAIFSHLKQHWLLYTCLIVVLVIGLIIGSMAPRWLTQDSQDQMATYIGNYLDNISQVVSDSWHQTQTFFIINGLCIGALFFFGMHLLGIPFILMILFVRGFTIGYAYTVISQAGSWPLLFIMLPINIIIIVLLLVAAAVSIRYCRNIYALGVNFRVNLHYAARLLLLLAIVAVCALFNGYIMPILVSIVV